jgi:hypothetical protein
MVNPQEVSSSKSRTFRAGIDVPRGAETTAGPPPATNCGGDVLPLGLVVVVPVEEAGGGGVLLLLSGLLLVGRSVSKLRKARLPLHHGGCC